MKNIKMINLKIDNILVTVPEGSTILEASKLAHVTIPTLCYLKEINAIGSCRICLVEVKNMRPLVAACVYPVTEGMEVFTHTDRVIRSRRLNLELILSTHVRNCQACKKSTKCELQRLSYEYGCNDIRFEGAIPTRRVDNSSLSIIKDSAKCILCKRCKAVCSNVQTVNAIAVNGRGFESYLGCAYGEKINKTACVGCGQCTLVCPTGALMEQNNVDDVTKALNDPNLITVVAYAPAVRFGIAEEFGYPMGTNAEGKLNTSLRMLGFKHVFDINFAADLTIMEEAEELKHRLTTNGVLPMITSCSPGWLNFLAAFYHEMLPYHSTAKSPQQMFGATLKTYWAEKNNVDYKKIFLVTVMPCLAKKDEIYHRKNTHPDARDVDAVLSVRELAHLLKRQGIKFNELKESGTDNPLGEFTGAGAIFGATGGVMEAALRTAADELSGQSLKEIEYTKVRGIKGIKKASVTIKDKTINVAVVSGLGNARMILEEIKAGNKNNYHFIEIMGCPGGCLNGGGMPIIDPNTISFQERTIARAKGIYKQDRNLPLRKSHENPYIIQLYKEYFEKPGSHKAHEILHSSIPKREFI